MSLVWSERGYPAAGAYRDYHHHTVHHHNPWNNDGDAYDHGAALALARRTPPTSSRARSSGPRRRGRGAAPAAPALVVCALDTELLGHWWYEGIAWLRAVVEECCAPGPRAACGSTTRSSAIEPVGVPALPRAGRAAGARTATSRRGPARRSPTWRSRRARPSSSCCAAGEVGPQRAVRELLALQASDWAFMVSRGYRRRPTRASASRATGARSRRRSPQGARSGRRAEPGRATSRPTPTAALLLVRV